MDNVVAQSGVGEEEDEQEISCLPAEEMEEEMGMCSPAEESCLHGDPDPDDAETSTPPFGEAGACRHTNDQGDDTIANTTAVRTSPPHHNHPTGAVTATTNVLPTPTNTSAERTTVDPLLAKKGLRRSSNSSIYQEVNPSRQPWRALWRSSHSSPNLGLRRKMGNSTHGKTRANEQGKSITNTDHRQQALAQTPNDLSKRHGLRGRNAATAHRQQTTTPTTTITAKRRPSRRTSRISSPITADHVLISQQQQIVREPDIGLANLIVGVSNGRNLEEEQPEDTPQEALGASAADSDYDTNEEEEETIVDDLEHQGNTTSIMLDLAVATPLDDNDDDDHLQRARPLRRRKSTNLCPQRRTLIWGLLFVVVVVVVVVVGITVAVKKQQEERPVDTSIDGEAYSNRKDTILALFPQSTEEAITNDPGSPQSLALLWLLDDPFFKSYTDDRIVTRFALVTLFFAAKGESWFQNENWTSYDTHECEWFFVSSFSLGGTNVSLSNHCSNDYGALEHLWLFSNGLDGNALVEEICLLESLQSIILFSNGALTGSIPSCVGRLTNLQSLMLNSNDLVGSIPSEIGLLSSLSTLTLFGNRLSNTIPSEIGMVSQLELFWAEQCEFTGTVPTTIGTISNLISLSLWENLLTGPIPTQISELKALQYFRITRNLLSGSLPSEIGQLQSAVELVLSHNKLEGSLPTEVGHLAQFRSSENLSDSKPSLYLNDNQFHGPIPSEVGLLRSMAFFIAENNRMSSTLPTELGRCEALETLFVHGNQLTSSLPSELGLLQNMTQCSVSRNSLNGSIVTELGMATSLVALWLYSNQLTSSLPTEMGYLTQLSLLHAYDNNISGPIPSQLASVQGWVEFVMGSNSLSGTIPSEFGVLATSGTLKRFDVSENLRLRGTIPSGLCRLESGEKEGGLLKFNCTLDLCGCESCACV